MNECDFECETCQYEGYTVFSMKEHVKTEHPYETAGNAHWFDIVRIK